MGSAQATVELSTDDATRFHDITDAAKSFVAKSGLQFGIAVAQSLHTTAGLLLNESENGLKADFAAFADKLVPRDHRYTHDDFSVRWENLAPEDFEAPNGHAHVQHAMFGTPSVALAIRDGELALGTWQRLFLIEYDRPRPRRVVLSAFGGMAPAANGHDGNGHVELSKSFSLLGSKL